MNLFDALKVNGKARRTSWINDSYHVIADRDARGFKAKDSAAPYDIHMSFENIIAEDWEPFKEPCQHEAKHLNLLEAQRMEFICKHCGIKIKAEKWVEA